MPAGSTTASGTSIADATWTLWEGSAGSWAIFSYVRSDNVTSATLDVMDFLDDLVTRGRVSNTKYLTGVQAGIEVRNGTSSGTLTTDAGSGPAESTDEDDANRSSAPASRSATYSTLHE